MMGVEAHRPLTCVKYDHLQPSLFPDLIPGDDRPLTSTGQARGVVGEFYEEASRVLTHGMPMKLQTGHLCPDLKIRDDHFLEVKGCGMGKQVVLYEHKVNQYRAFVDAGNKVTYLWWFHGCSTSTYTVVRDLRHALALGTTHVVALDFEDVWDLLEGEDPTPININSSNGRQDLTGWRFTWTRVLNRTGLEQFAGFPETVFGKPMKPHTIRRSPRVSAYKDWSFPYGR